jgi:hypothetical protein
LATTFLVAVFVFSAVFFISILESDISFFSLVGDAPNRSNLFAGLMHDELFDPTTMRVLLCRSGSPGKEFKCRSNQSPVCRSNFAARLGR